MPPLLPTNTTAQTPEIVDSASETVSAPRRFLHPASGGLILGLDWLLFSGTVATAGVALPASILSGFLLSSVGVTAIQRFIAGDSRTKSALKGLAAGIVVGAPFPVAGTAVGGGILMLSGLDQLLRRKPQQQQAASE